jgi:hypothetical protein
MKLLFSKQNYKVLSPSTYTHISVRDFYISRIGLPILLQGNMWTDPGNIWIAHRHVNVEIRTEAAQFTEKEYINGIFLAVYSRNVFSHYSKCMNLTKSLIIGKIGKRCLYFSSASSIYALGGKTPEVLGLEPSLRQPTFSCIFIFLLFYRCPNDAIGQKIAPPNSLANHLGLHNREQLDKNAQNLSLTRALTKLIAHSVAFKNCGFKDW